MLDVRSSGLVELLLAGNKKIVKDGKRNEEFKRQYGKDQFFLSNLSESQLQELRNDISLCSCFISDYENRFSIDPKQVCMLFDGYAEYIGELMEEDGISDEDYFEYLPLYDTIDNLVAWHAVVYDCMF